MKITVLTILILTLMAGLAMIQMDANTENQIQVLRETEMLTTQGLGPCEVATLDTDLVGGCATKACFPLGILNWAAERTGEDYTACRVKSNDFDCIVGAVFNPDGTVNMQTCANGTIYRNGVCVPANKITTYKVRRHHAVSVHGCDDDDGGGSTSS